MMEKPIKRFLAKNRKNLFISRFSNLLGRLHQGYENLDYDFFVNGEYFVFQTLQNCLEVKTIFDVGANTGAWSRISASTFPNAQVHSFEIIPETCDQLVEQCRDYKNISTYNLGFSDEALESEAYYSSNNSELATCVKDFSETFHGYKPEVVKVKLVTGDEFCSQRQVRTVDYLKIDVEGYEQKVLKGFEESLQEGKIKVIQFEYGRVNIQTKFLLKDFYDYLGTFNMRIGKIYPNYVNFKNYDFSDENFYGPNYLAVNADLVAVINALSC